MNTDYADLFQHMEAGTLHTCDFDHESHIGVAYQALEKYPFFDALAVFAKGIQAAAAASGAADKFHATITMAFMSMIAERRATGTYCNAADFVTRNQDLCAKDLLRQWYTSDLLGGNLARSIALMPDRVAETV